MEANRSKHYSSPLSLKLTRLSFAMVFASLGLVGCSDSSSNGSLKFVDQKSECDSLAIPNQFIVRWKSGAITLERAKSSEDFKKEFMKLNDNQIEMAEPNYRVRLEKPVLAARSPASSMTENFPKSAARDNSIEALDYDPTWGQDKINAPAVWAKGYQGQGIVVAVVDSGVDLTHPQLVNQMSVNPKEKAGNGLDDDANGVIDDVYGYDFDQMSPNVTDGTNHGTHVSGVVLADHTNGEARGLAPQAKLVPIDFMDDEGNGDLVKAVMGIEYAVKRGARVINASWGGSCSAILERKIGELEDQNVLFVAAAGNDGLNLDNYPRYPAAYTLPAMIVVGASTSRDYQISWSNYSYGFVHLLAPGDGIFSTIPVSSGRHGYMSGTSMATPFVSGAAAVLLSARPNATNTQVREALFASVHPGNYQVQTRGRLDLDAALEHILSHVAPSSSVQP